MSTFKYILKRILIGVGITLALLFIKGNILMQVQAKSILTHKAPFESYSYNNTVATFTTTIASPFFANANVGNLYFTFAVNKSSGNATFPISIIRTVVAYSGSTGYVCNIGSSSLSNSTYGGITYSAQCPMNIGSSGITKIVFYPSDLQSNDLSIYRFTNEGYYSFETDSTVNITVDTSSTTNAINNQTSTIINNQNQNTQDIINNQIDLLGERCKNVMGTNDYSSISWSINQPGTVSYGTRQIDFTTNGNAYSGLFGKIATFANLDSSKTYTVSFDVKASSSITFMYGISPNQPQQTIGTSYQRISYTATGSDLNTKNFVFYCLTHSVESWHIKDIQIEEGSTSSAYCPYGSPASSKLDTTNQNLSNVNQSINNVNNTLNNDNVSSANNFFDDYIEDFDPNTHGLTRIVMAPIQLVSNLLDTSCSSLVLPLPFVNQNITIPCMSSIYTSHFPTFLVIYRLITDGVISYWVCVNVFRKVKAFLDPTDDKVEVFDL